MMHYWAKYRETDGAIVMIGHSSTAGEMALQADRHAGLAVIEADGPTILEGMPSQALYLEAVKVAAAAIVDNQAEQLLSLYLAPGRGVEALHAMKEAEARSIVAGEPGGLGLLTAEAEALGLPIADLARQVLAKAETDRSGMTSIEIRRRTAKVAIAAADSVLAVAAARREFLAA